MPWDDLEQRLIERETVKAVYESLDRVPVQQRQVLVMRDIEGLDSGEVRDILGITDGNQRVLLHRARSKVRARLESYLDEAAA